jgi:hypothetical protein
MRSSSFKWPDGGSYPPVASLPILAKFLLLLAFVIAIWMFAVKQEVWLDETTQLSGITLNFADMLRWLGGQDVGRFGVLGDRMPPVSYILDWTWLRLFGPSELGFRLFHAAFLVAGVVLLGATARRYLGLTASFMTLGILVLSPKLIGTAVEIRSYSIFFALSCIQTALFVRILDDSNFPDRRLLAAFVLVSIVSIYTHFFGLVSSSAFFSGLGLAYIRHPRALIEIIVAFAVTMVASAGALPFIFSAMAQSSPSIQQPSDSHRYLNYLFKLLGDSANMVLRPAAALFLGGAGVLFLMSAFTNCWRIVAGRAQSTDWLLVVIVAGASATCIASLLVKNFDILKASYSIWLLAPLSLFLAGGMVTASRLRFWNGAYGIVAAATLAGAALSTYTFLVHDSEFIHGPGAFVGAIYDRAQSPKAVVYESDAAWGWSYFPLVFSHNGEIAQYASADGGTELDRTVVGPHQLSTRQTLEAVAPYKDLVLVDIALRNYRDIRDCNKDACPQFQLGVVEKTLTASGRWRQIAVERKFGLYDTRTKIFRRVD